MKHLTWSFFFTLLINCLATGPCSCDENIYLENISQHKPRKKPFADVDENDEDYPFFLPDDDEEYSYYRLTEENIRTLQFYGYEEIQAYITNFFCHRPEHIDLALWESLRPYLLPIDHPIKEKLDDLFKQKERVTLNQNTLAANGFTNTKPGKWSKTIVTKHPHIKGYLLKLFTDDQTDMCDWEQWITRIEGANSVRKTIEQLKCKHIFKVPKKWIYPLPNSANPSENSEKNFILVVEDMQLIDEKSNQKLWKTKISEHHLDTLHDILEIEGLLDTVYPFNLPFTNSGKLAFIDTEHHHEWPIRYHKLIPYLSESNQHFWKQITHCQ